MRLTIFICLWIAFLQLPAHSASDEQWVVQVNGLSDWVLSSVSSSDLFTGTLPANDPAINLMPGKRYAVFNSFYTIHPFQIIAAGGAGDTVLLSQTAIGGSLEGNASVQWFDSGDGTIEFTLSQALIDAMNVNGEPGYRCGIHTAEMRGAFIILGTGAPIADPIPQAIPKGDIRVDLSLVAEGLVAPLGLVESPDASGRLFVWDQVGKVWIIQNSLRLPVPLMDVASRLVNIDPSYDERGLLGLAFHPDFASNGKIYTYTSEPVAGTADFDVPMSGSPDHHSVVAEWQVSSTNANAVDMGSRREVLRIAEPQSNHNGGAMAFASDGRLLIAVGDGGAADDEGEGHAAEGNGEDLDRVLGKILRINVDGRSSPNGQYNVPSGNPFVGMPGLDEIWAYGLRNPYSLSVDSLTGELYVGDVGQNDIEEIDKVVAGGNYGWRIKEGSFFFDRNGDNDGFVTDTPVVPVPPGLIEPVAQYDHDEGSAVIVAGVYRGQNIPRLTERLVFGDLADGGFGAGASGRLFYLREDGAVAELRIGAGDVPLGAFLKGFGRDIPGEMYACVSNEIGPSGTTGKVFKIVNTAAVRTRWEMYR